VKVFVCDGVAEAVRVGVRDGVGVSEGVFVAVGVRVGLGVDVDVTVGVSDCVGVAEAVALGVYVGSRQTGVESPRARGSRVLPYSS
jgi:hypothetical protein